MGIYRGPGGTGDAVNDASSEALITVQAKDAALAAQAAAEAAQAAAELAETNAETAEANAELAETNAELAETNAEAAQAAAEAAQLAAEAAQTAAELAETNAETAETNAAASASAASTSASNAASSASAASTSASNAASSASAASTSASNAASSASAAAASYDSFDDRYLGSKTSDPTLDNDGNALLVGALYFNSSANEMRVWNGSSWQAASTVGGTVSSLTVTGAFAANGSTTIGDAAGDSVTINASTVSTPNGISFNGTSIPASKTLVVTTDIGSTVQAYDADTAKYDDVTANFTGTLQNGGSNVVVDSDIGVTVQAYDAQLADVAGLTPADNNFIVGNGTNFVTESGSTARTSLGLGSIATQDANNVAVTGGSINGTTVGASIASTGAFTTLSATGDVTIADKIVHSGDTDTAVRFPAADTVTVETSGAERMRIDSAGTVGIGVTPSPWSTYKTLQIGNGALFNGTVSGTDYTIMVSNAYTDTASTYKYIGSNFATAYYQFGGNHAWFTAPSGTAGNTATFTERMRIDSSGNVGIGTSSPASRLGVSGGIQTIGTAGGFPTTGTGLELLYDTSQDSAFVISYNRTSSVLKDLRIQGGIVSFSTGTAGVATERMRIDSSGNVGIGTSSPSQPVELVKNQDASTWFHVSNNNAGTGAAVGYLMTNNTGVLGALQLNSSTNSTSGAGNAVVLRTLSTNPLIFGTNSTERMRITSAGKVGIGTSSPNFTLSVNSSINDFVLGLYDNTTYPYGFGIRAAQLMMYSASDGDITFGQMGSISSSTFTERMRITSGGDVGIGTSSPSQRLHVRVPTENSNIAEFGTFNTGRGLVIGTAADGAVNDVYVKYNAQLAGYGGHIWQIGGTERMRIDSNGDVLVGKTVTDFGTAGTRITNSGTVNITRSSGQLIGCNRLTDDGNLIEFYQASTLEGTISVSGTTVSYNGGHLSRYAQTNVPKDGSLLKGTVLSNLDEMNEYIDSEGNPVENEQLNKVKVSDVEGDVNVAGVFVNWSHDEQHNVDEINMAMTGDMIIRIAQGVVVQKGDLLMSAGDGTAKPQGDDIVRSKTIAKVTSNHVTCTYADGSYCVPCVLMAC